MGRSADSRFAGSGRSTMAIVLPLRFRGGIGGRALVRHEVELRHDHVLHFERERRKRVLLVHGARVAAAFVAGGQAVRLVALEIEIMQTALVIFEKC